MSHSNEFCGVDKWYDNHFAYDAFWNTSLDKFKAAFDKHDRIYHIYGDCKPSKMRGPGTNIYVRVNRFALTAKLLTACWLPHSRPSDRPPAIGLEGERGGGSGEAVC